MLSVDGLKTYFGAGANTLRAVDGVSFSVAPGETVGLVGESGCGKSTLGKTLLQLIRPTAGQVLFEGADVGCLQGRALRTYRSRVQMVFQDPLASLNPRQSIGDILAAPLAVHRVGSRGVRREAVLRILERVGLPPDALPRYPHEFSGGQRQRIGIARALVLQPRLVICDEPVSALDVSIKAQILNLLVDAKRDLGLSYLFISHDLSVVRYFADRVLVMYLGRIIESGNWDRLWSHPLHPYTQALIEAVPTQGRRRHAAPLSGDLPSARDLPPGCRFHPRCPRATAVCAVTEPPLVAADDGQSVACHHPGPSTRH